MIQIVDFSEKSVKKSDGKSDGKSWMSDPVRSPQNVTKWPTLCFDFRGRKIFSYFRRPNHECIIL